MGGYSPFLKKNRQTKKTCKNKKQKNAGWLLLLGLLSLGTYAQTSEKLVYSSGNLELQKAYGFLEDKLMKIKEKYDIRMDLHKMKKVIKLLGCDE